MAANVQSLSDLARGRSIVALTGAGLSTESGIPDYRSPGAPARTPVQGPDFARSESVRRRYWARSLRGWPWFRSAQPNRGHMALVSMERAGIVRDIVTQNVDRLHTKAGSARVTELHGALADTFCLRCGAAEDRDRLQERLLAANPDVDAAASLAPDGDADLPEDASARFTIVPCEACGGILKPKVVFFGDNVPKAVVEQAFAAVDAADLLLVVGSSLAVFSGYRFLRRAVERKIPIVIANRGPVRGEEHATLKIEASTGETLSLLATTLVPTP